MISNKLQDVLNNQIKNEEHSSRIYLAMASWCEMKGYEGAAEFLFVQADEEKEHMLKLIHYLNDRGGHAVMQPLDQPKKEWDDLKKLFEEVLAHEEFITGEINKCYETALNEKDYNTAQFLQWYVEEQIEEESTMNSILDKINLAGGTKGGMLHVDMGLKEMAKASAAKSSGKSE